MAVAGVLVACSSDDTVVTAPDAAPFEPPYDSSIPDAAVPDTSTEVDAGFTIESYNDLVADTLCNSLTRCCYGNADVPQDGGVDGGDAGSYFDRAACHTIFAGLGFESSNQNLLAAKANVALNQAKGVDCINKITALSCNLGLAELKAARAVCFGALEGQLQAGAACKSSMECASGTFCKPSAPDASAADGGTLGQCAALRASGDSCNVFDTGEDYGDSSLAELACSSRAGGDTGLGCTSNDRASYLGVTARTEWKCGQGAANGEHCLYTTQCADGICDPGDDLKKYTCEPALTYFNRVACTSYIH
jgi:hypothetical protein